MAPLIIAGSTRMSWPAFLAATPTKKRATLSAPTIGLSAAALRQPPSVSDHHSAQQLCIFCDVATGDVLTKGLQQASVIVGRLGGDRAIVAHRAACPRCQLSAGRPAAAEPGRRLVKRGIENTWKQEGGTLRGRQSVERQQQGE